jgi:uncharacterized delta-60 repeat protein
MRLAISKAGKPDGTLDPVFSSNGKKITDLGGDDLIYGGVLVQDDGKIVTLGYSEGSSSSYDFALARFNPNGTLDGTFGGAGKQETDLGHADFIHSAAVQSDGKIIAGGEVCPDGGPCDFALARYDEDGALDTSFGDGGVAGTAFPAGGDPTRGWASRSRTMAASCWSVRSGTAPTWTSGWRASSRLAISTRASGTAAGCSTHFRRRPGRRMGIGYPGERQGGGRGRVRPAHRPGPLPPGVAAQTGPLWSACPGNAETRRRRGWPPRAPGGTRTPNLLIRSCAVDMTARPMGANSVLRSSGLADSANAVALNGRANTHRPGENPGETGYRRYPSGSLPPVAPWRV